ncbi:hypothetical protein F5883DRAFT_516843 [Diaporthe sp. PMI_573]|nr:hypothetical protein F5883DRAFT_516843 [Diaporthaceae sp. PMI_573]
MNGGQQQQTQHQQGTEAHQPTQPQPDPDTATTTIDENSTGGGVGLTTVGTGAAPTVKMQQSRQEAPAVTPATVTAAAAPAMTTASAAATAVAAAAAATVAGSPTASGANGSGGNNNGVGSNSPTTAAQTVAAINKKRKKEGLKPIITTDNPAIGSTLFCPDLDLDLDLVCVSPLILCWVVLCGVPQHGGSELSTDQVAFWFEIAEKSVGRPLWLSRYASHTYASAMLCRGPDVLLWVGCCSLVLALVSGGGVDHRIISFEGGGCTKVEQRGMRPSWNKIDAGQAWVSGLGWAGLVPWGLYLGTQDAVRCDGSPVGLGTLASATWAAPDWTAPCTLHLHLLLHAAFAALVLVLGPRLLRSRPCPPPAPPTTSTSTSDYNNNNSIHIHIHSHSHIHPLLEMPIASPGFPSRLLSLHPSRPTDRPLLSY